MAIPFKAGDRVTLNGCVGTVQDVSENHGWTVFHDHAVKWDDGGPDTRHRADTLQLAPAVESPNVAIQTPVQAVVEVPETAAEPAEQQK